MVIGSHNAWSYAKPVKWWMKLIRFTARCLKYDIRTQCEKYDSRCFDLRVRFDDNALPLIVHGPIIYNVDVFEDLKYLNERGDCFVRVVLDIRTKKDDNDWQKDLFKRFCKDIEHDFKNIKFFCGDNLLTKEILYNFDNPVSCEELYSSVTTPKLIDDWFPWIYAKIHNKKNASKGTDKDVLLIDFVNIR